MFGCSRNKCFQPVLWQSLLSELFATLRRFSSKSSFGTSKHQSFQILFVYLSKSSAYQHFYTTITIINMESKACFVFICVLHFNINLVKRLLRQENTIQNRGVVLNFWRRKFAIPKYNCHTICGDLNVDIKFY